MQVVELYYDQVFDFIKARIKAGWKIVTMTCRPFHIYDYGSKVQSETIVVYETPDKPTK